jgi:hypothetical protein
MIGDRVVGRLPLADETWLLPGDTTLLVRKDGFEEQTFHVHVQAGNTQTVDVVLREPTATTAPVPTVSAEPTVPSITPGPDIDERAPSKWQTYSTWGSFGISAVALTFGIISHVQHESDTSKFNDSTGQCFKGDGNVLGGSSCESLDRKISTDLTHMTIGYIGAAAFAGLGAVLGFTSPTKASGPVACDISPGDVQSSFASLGGTVRCVGTF